jgi:putative transposase
VKKSRFTEQQIVGVLKESEAGAKTPDLCRKHGISPATFYKWKSKFGGLEVSDVAKMRGLEDENRRLKRLLADSALEIDALKLIASGNF